MNSPSSIKSINNINIKGRGMYINIINKYIKTNIIDDNCSHTNLIKFG